MPPGEPPRQTRVPASSAPEPAPRRALSSPVDVQVHVQVHVHVHVNDRPWTFTCHVHLHVHGALRALLRPAPPTPPLPPYSSSTTRFSSLPSPSISIATLSPAFSHRLSVTLDPLSSSRHPVPHVPLPMTSPGASFTP